MRKYASLALVTLLLYLLLAACGPIAASSGNDSSATLTSAPAPTATATPTATPTPTPSKNYAFVRDNQLWLAINGAQPVQATHFDQILDPPGNAFWGQPLWFDHDQYLAFTLRVLNYGLGGNSCDVNFTYGKQGELFILNTTTMQMTSVKAPGDSAVPVQGMPYDGHWQYAFPEDATHLLAWHSAQVYTKETSQGGLYRYDVTTNALSLVIPASGLPETAQNDPYYTMRYSSGQLFYEVAIPDGTQSSSHFVIYSHSISHPDTPSAKVLAVGDEPYCNGSVTTMTRPGWDISPDGKYLVAQVLDSTNIKQLTSKIQAITLQSGSTTPLFTQLPDAVFTHQVVLKWSPDSQSVLLAQAANESSASVSLYTTTIANPGTFLSYTTSTVDDKYELGAAYWNGDNTTFALYGYSSVYVFTVGQPDGQQLLPKARFFAWGGTGR